MKMSRKMFKLYLSLIVIICIMVSPVLAAQIDDKHNASLTISYKDNDKVISGAEFKLFRVADISDTGGYTLSGDFASYSVSFENLTNVGWTDLAGTLAIYAERDNIKPLETGVTNSGGKLTFTGKSVGLYLVTGNKCSLGKYVYTPEPFLVSLPSLDVNNTWEYNVTSEPKFSSENPSSPDDPNTPNNPNPPGGGGGGGSTTTSRTVIKKWKDNNNKNGKRPESIVAQLLKNGKVQSTVILNEENGWQHTWSNLNRIYNWEVAEETVPDGYTVSINNDGKIYTITNTSEDISQIPDSPSVGDPTPDDTEIMSGSSNISDVNRPSNPGDPSNPSDPSDPNDPNTPNNSSDANNPPPSNPAHFVNKILPPGTKVLPQTGMLWWPVYIMYILGLFVFVTGWKLFSKEG